MTDLDDIGDLRAEVERLRNVEALRDILQDEVNRLRKDLNEERIKGAKLHDAIEGMTDDMSLMEARIAELENRID